MKPKLPTYSMFLVVSDGKEVNATSQDYVTELDKKIKETREVVESFMEKSGKKNKLY